VVELSPKRVLDLEETSVDAVKLSGSSKSVLFSRPTFSGSSTFKFLNGMEAMFHNHFKVHMKPESSAKSL